MGESSIKYVVKNRKMDKQHFASAFAGMITGTSIWMLLPTLHTLVPALITAALTGSAAYLGTWITKQIIKKWKR